MKNRTIEYEVLSSYGSGYLIQYNLLEFREENLDNLDYIQFTVDDRNNKNNTLGYLYRAQDPQTYLMDVKSGVNDPYVDYNLYFIQDSELVGKNFIAWAHSTIAEYENLLRDIVDPEVKIEMSIKFPYEVCHKPNDGCEGEWITYTSLQKTLVTYEIIFKDVGQEQQPPPQLPPQINYNNTILGLGLGIGVPLVLCGIILAFTSIYRLLPKFKKEERNKEKYLWKT